MSSLLIVIPKSFPFGKGEPFLESEAQYFKKFDKVLFISHKSTSNLRDIGNINYEIIQVNHRFKITPFISSILNKDFISELIYLIKSKKISIYNILQLINFIYNAKLKVDALKQHLEKVNNYDEVYIYSYWLHYNAYAAIEISKIVSGDNLTFSRAHRFDIYENRNRGNYLPFRKKILNSLDIIFPISNDAKDYINKKYNDIKAEIVISRLGAKDNGLSFYSDNREKCFKIVSCSRIVPVKRIERIISALSRITEINIEWTHIGGGALEEEIKQQANSLLNSNVKSNFVGEFSNKQVYEYYKSNQFDVFINVSSSEGIPVSIMEAMSFGIPVIGTDVGGTSEVVNETNGILLKENFKDIELIKAINHIRSLEYKEYINLRKHARNTFLNKYNSDKNYREFVDLIKVKFNERYRKGMSNEES